MSTYQERHDRRHELGCRAIGMLKAIADFGCLDSLPETKADAIKLSDDFDATIGEPEAEKAGGEQAAA